MFRRPSRLVPDPEQGTLPTTKKHSHRRPPPPPPPHPREPPLPPREFIVAKHKTLLRQSKLDIFKEIVQNMYNNIYFKLPYMYFSRVQRVFEAAKFNKADLDFLVRLNGVHGAIFMAGLTGATIGFGSTDGKGMDLIDGSRWAAGILDSKDPLEKAKLLTVEGLEDAEQEREEKRRTRYLARRSRYGNPQRDYGNSYQRDRSFGSDSDSDYVPDPRLIKQRRREQNSVFPKLKLERFMYEWSNFIDDSMQEWNIVNIVNALLLSAVLTMFQIDGAANNQITRTFIFLSLVCALISLVFGSAYTLRFTSMKTVRQAVHWVDEAERSQRAVFWNVWIILSLPTVWLAWSIIGFIISIMIFLWTTSGRPVADPQPLPDDYNEWTDLYVVGPRVVLSLVFLTGLIEVALVLNKFREWAHGGGEGDQLGMFPAPRELWKRREKMRKRAEEAKKEEEEEKELKAEIMAELAHNPLEATISQDTLVPVDPSIAEKYPNEAAYLSRF